MKSTENVKLVNVLITFSTYVLYNVPTTTFYKNLAHILHF